MKEESLSKKIFDPRKKIEIRKVNEIIRVEDIKEAVRRLKEEEDEMIRIIIRLYPHKHGEELASEILERLNSLVRDKIFGDKLIDKEKKWKQKNG